MRLSIGHPFGPPAFARLRNCLKRTRLIFAEYRQTNKLTYSISLLNCPFFPVPRDRLPLLFRLYACAGQFRWSTTFYSAANCSLPHAVSDISYTCLHSADHHRHSAVPAEAPVSDQVAVPSFSKSGSRATSSRIRDCSASPYFFAGPPP